MNFQPGKDLVPVSGAVFDGSEQEALIEVARELSNLNPHVTAGKRHHRFERELAEWFGVGEVFATNSGSSANLLAIAALCSPQLPGHLKPGDEVITVACGFPTTVAPIVQHGLVPVFVDVKAPDYNVDASQLEAAMSSRVKAVMLAHTLGFPFDVAAVEALCRKYDLFFVEDNCDAFGAKWGSSLTGTFGRLTTLSFYPAHHMTTGEGGAVLTSDRDLAKIVASLRDWGRDCHCPPGCDNTCGRRFDQEHGSLPVGYDHKYVYSHLGYSLRMTEMQAAIGIEQVKKLDRFIARRRATWRFYRDALADLGDVFEFADPPPGCDPSPFGFLLTCRVTGWKHHIRDEIVRKLEAAGVRTRPLFAGNLLRHPAMRRGVSYRTMQLPVTDSTVFSAFWIGVYPGITDEMREYVVDQIRRAVR